MIFFTVLLLISTVFAQTPGSQQPTRENIQRLRDGFGQAGAEAIDAIRHPLTSRRCQPESLDWQTLDCKIPNFRTQGNPKGLSQIAKASEELLFNEMARRSALTSQCQFDALQIFENDPQKATLLFQKAQSQFAKIQPVLHELKIEKERLQTSLTANMAGVTGGAFSGNSVMAIQKQIQQIDVAIQAKLAEIPMGRETHVMKFLKTLPTNQPVSLETFQQGLKPAFRSAKADMKKSIDYFSSFRIKTGERAGSYDFVMDEGRQFVLDSAKNGQYPILLDSLGADTRTKEVMSCYVERRFQTGQTVQVVTAELALTAVGGLAGRAVMALRALQNTSMAAKMTFVGVDVVTAGGLSAANTQILANEIGKNCYPEGFVVNAKAPTCNAETEFQSIMQEAAVAECASTIVLAALPAVTYIASKVARAVSAANNSGKTVMNQGSEIGDSGFPASGSSGGTSKNQSVDPARTPEQLARRREIARQRQSRRNNTDRVGERPREGNRVITPEIPANKGRPVNYIGRDLQDERIIMSALGRGNMTEPMKRTSRKVWKKLHDEDEWNRYIETLQRETKEMMLKSSDPSVVAMARAGKLRRNEMLKVLVQRGRQRGEQFGVLTDDNAQNFLETMGRGPFFDMGVPPDTLAGQFHGVDIHLIQRDFVSDVVKKEMGTPNGGNEFYQNLSKDSTMWNSIFDTIGGPASPERTYERLERFLPIQ